MLDAIASDAASAIAAWPSSTAAATDAGLAALHRGGVRGVRFNFVRHLGGAPDPDVFRRVLGRIKPLGWHVVLHLDAADIVPLGEMIRGLPLPFVIDHMGRVDSSLGLEQPAFQRLARSREAGAVLDQGFGLRADFAQALRRRDAVRPRAGARRTAAGAVGHRLPASEPG